MSPKKGLRTGILLSGVVVFSILAVVLVGGIRAYDGNCLSFEPPNRPCGLLEFLVPYTLLVAGFSAFDKPFLSLGLILLIVGAPLVGFIVGKRRSNRAPDY